MTQPKPQLKHVLVADDSPTIHKAVRLTLPENEFSVSVAHNGKEALEQVKSGHIDLVLADVNMPELNGYDLSSAIKLHLNKEKLPVILMCGTFDKFDQDKFIWSKANHRIWKPFETTSFLEIVRQYLKPTLSQTKPAQAQTQTQTHTASAAKSALSQPTGFSSRAHTSVVEAKHAPESNESYSVPRKEPMQNPLKNALTNALTNPTPKNTGMSETADMSTETPTETSNVGFHVETVVRKWLDSNAGKALIEECVRKEVATVLSKIEAEIIESLKQAPLEEELSPQPIPRVNVVNPF